MAKKTPPFEEYPDWTVARFFGFLRSGLRAKWLKWPPRYKVLAKARRIIPPAEKAKRKIRHRFEFKCAECNDYHPQKMVEVDHIESVGSLKSFEEMGDFCRRLFVREDKLQVVCKPCHLKITKERKDEKAAS